MAARALVIRSSPDIRPDMKLDTDHELRHGRAQAALPPPSEVGSASSLESYLPAEENAAQGAWEPELREPPQPAAPKHSSLRDAVAASPHRPVMVLAEELPGVTQPSPSTGALPVNNGRPIPIEGELFCGQACVFISGLPSASPALFEGKRRKSLLVAQGRFMTGVGYDDLVTGQEFERAKNLPPAWLLDNVLLKVARAVSPSMQVGPASAPFMLMPVVAGANEIHVARPGEEPALVDGPREDMRLADKKLTAADGSPLPLAQRRAFFSNPANRAGRSFDPDLIWTFYFYQHLVDLSSYTLNMVYRFHLPRYLDGQPLQLMMKDQRRGRYLMRLQVWHQELLADVERHAAKQAQQQAKRA